MPALRIRLAFGMAAMLAAGLCAPHALGQGVPAPPPPTLNAADPPAEKPRSASGAGARVFFLDLQDGAAIPARATVRFGVGNIGIVPAGTKQDNGGHHHLLIDTELPPLDREIPSDFNHVHFGRGQTEVTLNLPPGEHTLQLLMADHDHIPHDPPVMSPRIKVRVVAAPAGATPMLRSPKRIVDVG